MAAFPLQAESVRVIPMPRDRASIEATIERLIGLLDQLDGDPDEENANDLEDDFSLSPFALGFAEGRGPGCAVADPDESVDDRPCDEPYQDLEYEGGPAICGGGSG